MERQIKTLEEVIAYEKKNRHEDGMFGIRACKESIKSTLEISDIYHEGKTLFTLLGEYYERYLEDICFNTAMILACWELINKERA